MSNSEWKTQEEYIAKYGSQEDQAAVQCRAKLQMDGPWRLTRTLSNGREIALDNSVRSTSKEINDLRDREYERTGVYWKVAKYV